MPTFLIPPYLLVYWLALGDCCGGIYRHLNVLGFEIEEREIRSNSRQPVISDGINGSY